PDSPTVISALYWIGKAKAHEGKMDEAKRLTADTIKKYIAAPNRDAVEMLLTQLAQLCVKRKAPASPVEPTPASAVAGVADAGQTTSSPSPPPEEAAAATPQPDPGAELDTLLGSTEQDQAPIAHARVIYAKAELARLRRQPAEEEKNIGRIAQDFKPDDLSPMLLGRAGDYLLATQKLDRAAAFYQRLLDAYPKSDYADFGYNGLAEIAYQKHDL